MCVFTQPETVAGEDGSRVRTPREKTHSCKCESLAGFSGEATGLPFLIHRIPTLSSVAKLETGPRTRFRASRDIDDAIGSFGRGRYAT